MAGIVSHRQGLCAELSHPGGSGTVAKEDAVGISIQDVRKSYDGKLAVDVTALEVRARTTLALIGPSGCGKSTLLRLVIGLIAPDRGRILIGDTPMAPETRRGLRLRMGY